MRFGGVKNEVTSSSCCLVSHSIIKSGNAAIRLFFVFITDPRSQSFVLSSSISIFPSHPDDHFPIWSSGRPSVDAGPRAAKREYISLSLLVSGFLR